MKTITAILFVAGVTLRVAWGMEITQAFQVPGGIVLRGSGGTPAETYQIVSATDLGAFGTKHFAIPFDAAGKAWVRFAVWDSAGNGAFVQPMWLKP